MITLICPDCYRRKDVASDKTDPPGAASMQLQCDQCDDGDRHSPEFYNADGEWIPPF